MRIGFYLDSLEPVYEKLARIAIAAVRKHMPKAQIWHLTAGMGPELRGVDEELRVDADGPYTLRRAKVQALISDILLLDVDCIVMGDVSEIWASDCSIALPEVADPFVRYTGAVMFIRDPGFWQGWIRHPIWGREHDVRELLVAFTEWVDAWPGKVLRLSQALYEALPANRWDPLAGARIAHYRGPRKHWITGL